MYSIYFSVSLKQEKKTQIFASDLEFYDCGESWQLFHWW